METYTRQQLHDLVWSGPMRDVAKKLGLSDNGLRKHCVKAFVPLPPQGHWNKVHAGQRVKTIPLSARPPGVSDTVSIGQWDYRLHERRLMELEPVPPIFDEPIEALRERIARNLGVVADSKSLSPPHAAFRRQVEDEARRAAQSSWHTSIFDYPLEKRRLRILRGLFYGLSRLDCSVEVRGREVRDICVTVGQQHVQVSMSALSPGGAPMTARKSSVSSSVLQDEDTMASACHGQTPTNSPLRPSSAPSRQRSSWLASCRIANIKCGSMKMRSVDAKR